MATLDTILNIQVTGTDKMTQLKNAIDNTAEELKQFKKEGQQSGETLKQYQAKVVTAETKLKALRGELTRNKTELIKNAKAVGATDKSYNSLTAQNAKLSASLRKLSDPLGKNRQEFDRLSGKIKQNTEQLKTMDSAMGRQQRNVGNYKQAITGVAGAVAGAVIAFKTFQRVLGTFVDFEFQIKQVGVISGATAEEMEMLSESAKALGASTAFTAGEVAGLQKELAKLGFNPQEIENMTSATLDLAFAFGNELAETGEIVGVVLNSYKLEASEATRVTDVLASAFSATALDLQKFNTAFPKVGAIANQLGFSLEGTTALLGELANAGLDASTAGTSLRSIFLKLADSNSALSKQFGGSVKSIDDLIPALDDLFKSGANVEEMLGLTDKRSVTAFATLASGAPKVAELTKEFENSAGTAKRFADVMRDSLKGSLDEATSSANGFVIELFEALAPAIELIVDGISLFFNALSTLVENFKAITIGVGAYTAVVVAGSIAQGTFTTAIVGSKAVTLVWNGVVKIAKALQQAWNIAVKANPIGLLVGALATGISILYSWNSATKDGTEEQEEQNKAVDDTIKKVDKLAEIREKSKKQQDDEIARLKALTTQIKNSNLTQKEREQALKDFNKLAGTNIKNLDDEKKIIEQVENAYDGAVDAIKRKIILQSTEQQVIELLKKQTELEEQIAIQKQNVADQTIIVGEATKNLNKINDERVANNARSVEQLIADGDNLIDNTIRVGSTSQEMSRQISNSMNDLTNSYTDFSGTLSSQVPQNIQNIRIQAESNRVATEQQLNDNEELKTKQEDLSLSYENSSTSAINAYKDVGNATEELEDKTRILTNTQNKNEAINKQIADIYAKQDRALKSLNVSTDTTTTKSGKLKTAYQQLKSSVNKFSEELTNQIVIGEKQKQAFINSEEAQTMSSEDKNKRIQEIEEQTRVKVEKATNKLIKAKKDLKVVDDQIIAQNKIVTDSLDEQVDAMVALRASKQETIDADNKQLEVLKALEQAGADVTRERIQQALKVAKAELDLALTTAEASGMSTDAQVENINRLKNKIDEFQRELNQSDGTDSSGFLQKELFGSSEDGNAFTGEDFLEAVSMTLGEVGAILNEFNALQQERLNTQLGIIESEKDAEIKAFKDSAEFQILTDEERTQRIEEIEKKHDDKMLALKIEQFEKDKKLAIANALISGAQGILAIIGSKGTGNVIADAIIKGILIASTIALTGLQIATIKAQAPPTAELGGIMDDSFFARGGMVQGRSHAQGGEKFAVGGRVVELEGGEAVINKRSTAMFKPQLSAMNVAGGGRKFADGGMVFSSDTADTEANLADSLAGAINDQQVILVEADVTESQKSVNTIESRISF